MTAQEILNIIIPACSMLIAALSLLGVIMERRSKDAKTEALLASKIEQMSQMLSESKDMISRLLDGYNNNEKRITLLEDRYKNLSGRVNEIERKQN